MHIEDVLTTVGKDRNTRITVSFNKLVRIKEYESERIQADMEFDLAPGENATLETMKAEAALEYEVLTMMLFKRQITQNEFDARKVELDQALTAYEAKLNSLTVNS